VATPIEIVTLDLDQPDAVVSALDAELPEVERTGRRELRVARAATRQVLGDALGVAPTDLLISRACSHCGHPSHGKPALVGQRLTFSLSHSHRLGVLAMSRDGAAIGVDVEQVRPRRHLDRLAARSMTAAELGTWGAHPEERQLRAFLDVWARKEAYLKALGLGLAADLRATQTRHDDWTIDAIDIGPGYCAVLAVDDPEIELKFSVWTPRRVEDAHRK
jgi:4'-phosphopantetheinyl transferase